jgi:sugar/nucleoside kinase (ribokinase family)
MYDMITIGDIKLDTFVVLDDASVECELKMPECQLCMPYGDKLDVDDIESQTAGSAPNVSTGLARMSFKTAVISNMGEDTTQRLAFETLKGEGVATEYINVVPDEESSFSVVLNFKGERTIITSHIEHAYKLPDDLKDTKWMYVCEMGEGYESLYEEVIELKKQNGMKLGLNPGSIQLDEKKDILYDLIEVVDVLFVNKEEAQDLTEQSSLEIHHLAKGVSELGPNHAVITDGKAGAYSFQKDELAYAPMFPGERVEATGAGDSFATGYIGALLNGESHDTALKWGSVNAASVVQYVGPTPGLLSAKEIRKQLEESPDYQTEIK